MKRKKIHFLSRFTKSGVIFKIVGFFIRIFVSLLFATLRIEIRGLKALQEATKRKDRPPLIIAFWHNQLLLVAPFLNRLIPENKFTVLISNSRDGELPAAFAETYHQAEVLRVGHKGRVQALKESIKILLEKRILVITPDGPRGPCYEVKPGIIFSASKSRALVFAMKWHATRAFRLDTWDKFCIPLPFSKVVVTISTPLQFTEEQPIEEAQEQLKNAL